jgi:hypothetical protein
MFKLKIVRIKSKTRGFAFFGASDRLLAALSQKGG